MGRNSIIQTFCSLGLDYSFNDGLFQWQCQSWRRREPIPIRETAWLMCYYSWMNCQLHLIGLPQVLIRPDRRKKGTHRPDSKRLKRAGSLLASCSSVLGRSADELQTNAPHFASRFQFFSFFSHLFFSHFHQPIHFFSAVTPLRNISLFHL